jgi:hypothetical protein
MLVGCTATDSPTQPAVAPSIPVIGSRVVLRGTAIKNPTGDLYPTSIVLLEADGTIVGLLGGQVASIASVLKAEVEVHGILDGTELSVESFLVLAVGGAPASDGVLQLIGSSYTLVLTGGGWRDVVDPSPALKAHVGERIWLTGADDASPTGFGVIAIPTIG